MSDAKPFWQTVQLNKITDDQWESLCDGCGKCCLYKLEDEDTGKVHYTKVACSLLDTQTIGCKKYAERKRFVPDCISLTPKKLKAINWLPNTCAYLLISQGKDLPSWHYLVSGSHDTIHNEGASIKDKIISEQQAGELKDHLVSDNYF
jgi:hypothetical protein